MRAFARAAAQAAALSPFRKIPSPKSRAVRTGRRRPVDPSDLAPFNVPSAPRKASSSKQNIAPFKPHPPGRNGTSPFCCESLASPRPLGGRGSLRRGERPVIGVELAAPGAGGGAEHGGRVRSHFCQDGRRRGDVDARDGLQQAQLVDVCREAVVEMPVPRRDAPVELGAHVAAQRVQDDLPVQPLDQTVEDAPAVDAEDVADDGRIGRRGHAPAFATILHAPRPAWPKPPPFHHPGWSSTTMTVSTAARRSSGSTGTDGQQRGVVWIGGHAWRKLKWAMFGGLVPSVAPEQGAFSGPSTGPVPSNSRAPVGGRRETRARVTAMSRRRAAVVPWRAAVGATTLRGLRPAIARRVRGSTGT